MKERKENLKVIITVGIPGSGKSTWAKEQVKKHANFVRVNRDDLRMMLKMSGTVELKLEDAITKMCKHMIVQALLKKMNVIVDNTHVKERYIKDVISWVTHMADVEFMVFDVPAQKCIERDALRESKVGKEVIEKMDKSFKILKDSFVFQNVPMNKNVSLILPDFTSLRQPAVIFDVDGTLAHMTKRGPFDWHKVHLDEFNPIVGELTEFHRSKGRTIIICSGRDESCRQLTADWLNMHGVVFDHMFMRPANDFRKDNLIKEEIYESHLKGKFNILCCVDDRLQVLSMWEQKGIFTFNVNQGLKEF